MPDPDLVKMIERYMADADRKPVGSLRPSDTVYLPQGAPNSDDDIEGTEGNVVTPEMIAALRQLEKAKPRPKPSQPAKAPEGVGESSPEGATARYIRMEELPVDDKRKERAANMAFLEGIDESTPAEQVGQLLLDLKERVGMLGFMRAIDSIADFGTTDSPFPTTEVAQPKVLRQAAKGALFDMIDEAKK